VIRRTVWLASIAVLVGALAFGGWPRHDAPRTPAQRVEHLATIVRCPTCSGVSVAQSEAPLARSARQEMERQVAAGRSDQDIEDYFIARYGDDALLTPRRGGAVRVAWVLPIGVAAVAVGVVVVGTRRWRRGDPGAGEADVADVRLVEEALEVRR